MKPLLPHGTHAAYNRHKNHRETPCAKCVAGEKAYQHHRHLRRSGVFTEVDGQQPLIATTRPQLPAAAIASRTLTTSVASTDVLDAIAAAIRGNYTVSYTRAHGLRLHVDPAVADDWIAAAPMADDDQPLAPVHHLPVSWTA